MSAAEWFAYFRAFHEALPSANDLFLVLRTRSNETSYSVLSGAVPSSARRVLDLACGDGNLIEELLSGTPPDVQIDAIDVSRNEIAIARRRFTGESRAHITTGDAMALPYGDAAFDCVAAHQFVNFLPEPRPFLDEIVRVLKPGGTFIFVANRGWRNDRDAMWIKLDTAAREVLHRYHPQFRWPTMGDMRIYEDEGIAQLFADHGGFDDASLSIESFNSGALLTPERVAAIYNRLYVYGLAPEKREVLDAVRERARRLATRGDLVELILPFRLVRICARS